MGCNARKTNKRTNKQTNRVRILSAYAASINSAVTDDNSLVQALGALLYCSRAAQFVTAGRGPDFLRGEIDLT